MQDNKAIKTGNSIRLKRHDDFNVKTHQHASLDKQIPETIVNRCVFVRGKIYIHFDVKMLSVRPNMLV